MIANKSPGFPGAEDKLKLRVARLPDHWKRVQCVLFEEKIWRLFRRYL